MRRALGRAGLFSAALICLISAAPAWDAPGDPDLSFGINGAVSIPFPASTLALQPDDKVLVAGWVDSVQLIPVGVARFEADGTPDATFGVGGVVIHDFGAANFAVIGVAVQSDGGVIVAGPSGPGDFAVARFDADGMLDIGFGAGGLVTIDLGGSFDAHALAIQSDDKIVVAGNSGLDVAVVRLDGLGGLDPTLDGDGIAQTTIAPGVRAQRMALQADGKLVVAGIGAVDNPSEAGRLFFLVRYDAVGQLDASFGTGGVVKTVVFPGSATNPHVATVNALVTQVDGRLLFAGAVPKPIRATKLALGRYSPDGTADTTLRRRGLLTARFSQYTTADAVQVAPSGSVTVAGHWARNLPGASGTIGGLALARFTNDGRPDRTFAPRGRVVLDAPAPLFGAAVFQPDGRLLALTWDPLTLRRFLP